MGALNGSAKPPAALITKTRPFNGRLMFRRASAAECGKLEARRAKAGTRSRAI